jgi:hypothetical protein
MFISGNKWDQWAPDGVTVEHFDAISEGKTLVLRSKGQPLTSLTAPSFRQKWAFSSPVAYAGQSLVFAARYLSPFGCVCHLFADGVNVRTGFTLDQVKSSGRASLSVPDAFTIATTVVTALPYILAWAMVRAFLDHGLTLQLVPFMVVAGLASLGIGLVTSHLGLWVLGWAHGTGKNVGLLSFAISACVLVACLAEAMVIARGLQPWLPA